ncbi:MAG: endonuclease/exonuclease/phosphatase family protein [Chromatiales bacterium]|nr:endonuclease/exonuclease/phosphatase family protein [Chromatiales bacterium]
MNSKSIILAALVMTALAGHSRADPVRFATFNASMNRGAAGELAAALRDGDDPQIAKVAEIIRAVDPDVIAINEFDHGAGLDRAFVGNYLDDAYPFSFIAPSNTGVATGLDLDGDGIAGSDPGTTDLARDSHGFGMFEGQYGMLVLSRHEIAVEDVRTFRTFRWRDMPGARLPARPDGTPFYSDEALDVLRLSSKSHWDVPVRIGGEVVHFLVSHPTPPVFDGPEDRNGARNADEIRFWSDYIAGEEYIHDDSGRKGGLANGAHFVIAGDLNADPADGESVPGAIRQLLDHPLVNASVTPRSAGGSAAAAAQGGVNSTHGGDPRFDTADFRDDAPGNLRVDYVLPSTGLEVVAAGVFWPPEETPEAAWLDASDHRPVWVDVTLPAR